jgi:hypothetical protein
MMDAFPRTQASGRSFARWRPEGWAAFLRPRTFLPQEHGGWFLFLTPLAVGLTVGRAWHVAGLAFALAALAFYMARRPLDLALRSLRGERTRVDLPALGGWLAIYGLLAAAPIAHLVLRERLVGLLPLAAAGLALLSLQLWAAQARRTRTAWSEVVSTASLGLAAAGGYYVGATVAGEAHTIMTALVLWVLCALQGVGGVLYSRWRLRRRRLSLIEGRPERGRSPATSEHDPAPIVPRVSVLTHHMAALAVAVAIAAAGLAPWAVTLLYAGLLIRVAWGTRPAAPPDRTVIRIGLGEGIVTLAGGVWLTLAFL